MPAEPSTRITAAATASSQPYSTEERTQYPRMTWLLNNRRLSEKGDLAGEIGRLLGTDRTVMAPQRTAALTQAALVSFSPCIEGPDYTMRDAWSGSTKTWSMWGSSCAESDNESVPNTVRRGDDGSDNQEFSHEGSDCGSVEGTVQGHDDVAPEQIEKVPEEPELPEENEQEKFEYGRNRRSMSPVDPPELLVLEAKWSPIRFGNRLPAVSKEEDEVTFQRPSISPEEKPTCGAEGDEEEERDCGLTTAQGKLRRVLPRLPALK
jgi:hypothetical protein